MNRHIFVWALLLTSVTCSQYTLAFDEWYVGPGPGFAPGVYGGYGPYGLGLGYGLGLRYGYGYGFQAQTPYSAEANAMGNLVRAQGDYNQASSKALIDQEEARRRYIDNQRKLISNRQEIKRAALTNDAKELENARAARAREEEFQAAHRPQPLSSDQLNPMTGAIQWPEILRADAFAETRKSLDALFEKRAKYGSSSDLTGQIRTKTGELKEALRHQIKEIPLAQYSESRKFLERLAASVN